MERGVENSKTKKGKRTRERKRRETPEKKRCRSKKESGMCFY